MKAIANLSQPTSLDRGRGYLTEVEKIEAITFHFRKIMETLGLDLRDDSLKDTPSRVAKMYVHELFSGLDPEAFPAVSLFENTYQYQEMLLERDIQVYSCCEHHFVPFVGRAHVAYFPGRKVIGLSKLNRIVRYFSRRPQVQERLTSDIASSLRQTLQTDDIAVVIEAKHLCVAARGVEDTASTTHTCFFGGRFDTAAGREMFYRALGRQ